MSRNPFDEAMDRELQRWPSVTAVRSIGGKHNRIILHHGDRSSVVVYPATPSDRRGVLNHIAQMRRILRDLGATEIPRRKSKGQRRYRKTPGRCTIAPAVEGAPEHGPSRDPWEALR